MAWSNVIGQGRAKQLLQRALERGTVAHAYLFHGREGVGQEALALEFARTLQCERRGQEACDDCRNCRLAATLTHPDLRLVVPLPIGKNESGGDDPLAALDADVIDALREQIGMKARDPYHVITLPRAQFIKINSIRDIKREASLSPVEGRFKIFVILGADAMQAAAANALLKTLEEPLANAVLLLTTSARQQLLPTILSRCQQVECSPLNDEELIGALKDRHGLDDAQAATAAHIADGSYGRARELVGEEFTLQRSEVVQFLRIALAGKAVALSHEAERLSKDRDRGRTEQWLELLQSWLRDALLVQTSGDRAGADDTQKNFLEKFPSASLGDAVVAVDDAIADLRKNVYLPLIVFTLAQRLRALLRNTAGPS